MSTSTVAGRDFLLLKPRNPFPSPRDWTGLRRLAGTLTLAPFPRPGSAHRLRSSRSIEIEARWSSPPNPSPFPCPRRGSLNTPSSSGVVSAGRSKKKPGGPSTGRIEGNADMRRRAKQAAKKKSRRMAENLFYRHNKTWGEEANSFTEEELQMIGLGYDRTVRFMEKDDPKLRHPHDWYKYGRYGPYSWRGIVVGSPIRGRFSDERVSIIGEVSDHEEWEEIEQHEMATDFSRRLESMDSSIGFRYFWVFVRHPKWRSYDLPWQQWTLVAEVAVEARNEQRIDKWSLMGRLGNSVRSLITQCAAWYRPDIIYVRRPVYQCRFEPQDNFFKLLVPLVDPDTEQQFICELKAVDGKVETCTYFAGLCKIVGISSKAFVDEVVEAYQKLSEEGKNRCLEFLLTNHPMDLLHPYTQEWKAKLEEMELGCDAPDHSNEEEDGEIVDWVEEEEDGGDTEEEEEDEVIDLEEGEDDEDVLGGAAEISDPEDNEEYWNEQWRRAMRDPKAMEGLVKKSIAVSNQVYENQREAEEARTSGDEQTPEETETAEWRSGPGGRSVPRRRTKRSRIPPELFLRAAVRPFTYRNLVKEIVLLRHAILDKEIISM